jgi:cobalt-zinc-cadmium efflux system outer membrane protein
MLSRSLLTAALVAGLSSLGAAAARAGAAPERLTLDEALARFRARSYDLLLADAAIASARGDQTVATALPNPQLQVQYAHVYNYNSSPLGFQQQVLGTCVICAIDGELLQLSDSNIIENTLTGKRSLRKRVAGYALETARMSRQDAQRTLEFALKQAYFALLAAQRSLAFARETQQFAAQMLDITRLRYPAVINEGQLARVTTDKLGTDAAVLLAEGAEKQAQAALGFLLGEQDGTKTFQGDESSLSSHMPAVAPDPARLLRVAESTRPDLKAVLASAERAKASVSLAERLRIPDMTLSLQWYAIGRAQNTVQPPQLSVGLTMNLPVFYQQQGEILKAQADRRTQLVAADKLRAQIASDLRSAVAVFVTARSQTELMENGGMLDAARRARDVMRLQYEAGSAQLTDYLDAQRTFIGTNNQYMQGLVVLRTALAQLEQAIGTDLRSGE